MASVARTNLFFMFISSYPFWGWAFKTKRAHPDLGRTRGPWCHPS